MTKQIGNDLATPEALAQMRAFRCKECSACKRTEAAETLIEAIKNHGAPSAEAVAARDKVLADNPCEAKWYAYQNHDLGHPGIGHLQFLAVGPGCTFKTPPERYPDTQHGLGWRYILVGKVNLETGAIEE